MSTVEWNVTATQSALCQIHSPSSGTSAGPVYADEILGLRFHLPWHDVSTETQYMSPLVPSFRSVPFMPAEKGLPLLLLGMLYHCKVPIPLLSPVPAILLLHAYLYREHCNCKRTKITLSNDRKLKFLLFCCTNS